MRKKMYKKIVKKAKGKRNSVERLKKLNKSVRTTKGSAFKNRYHQSLATAST